MWSHRAGCLSLTIAFAAACSEDVPAPGSVPSGADAGNGDIDGGRDDAAGAGDATSGGDSGGPGAPRIPTVAAGSVRITPTEISQGQYKAFLDDVAGKSVTQPLECSWNLSFAPGTGADCALDAGATPNRPVRCVDWCDARAYCEWAGLRLCGKIGGGPNPLGAFADPASSQWQAACGGSANKAYPYGSSLNQAACSFSLGQSGPPTDVGTMPACEGGYPGLFDMLGNMGEWEDSCGAASGPSDQCRIRGGYYTHDADAVTCGSAETQPRNQQSPTFGIRCCSK